MFHPYFWWAVCPHSRCSPRQLIDSWLCTQGGYMHSALMNTSTDGCGSFPIMLCFYKKMYTYSISHSIWCIYINGNCYISYSHNNEVKIIYYCKHKILFILRFNPISLFNFIRCLLAAEHEYKQKFYIVKIFMIYMKHTFT